MIRWFVHHGTTVILATLAMFLFGWWSYVGLPRESAPDIQIPLVIVSAPYIGVSPEDVEGLVTIPLESELASLTDVKRMTSSSAEGVSVVAIEFEPEVNLDEALQKVRDRVARARGKLPDDVEEPTVSEVSFSDIPVLLVTLSGADEQTLKRLAESLEDEVTRVPGVLEADVSGGREREVRVQVDPYRLAHYGLSLFDVQGAIAGENVNIPGGDVVAGNASILLRTPGEITSAAEVEEVAIKRVGDRPVLVTDVARVVDDFEDRETYARMGGRPSVTLAVKKRTGANLLEVAGRVRGLVAERSAAWPSGVTYRVTGDQSEDIESMVAELENNMITALLLVVGVVLVFMGARSALFVALSIPLSMFLSFLVIDVLGYTLNMVVLFSLILALGMLVDNAIVVVENVYRHLEMGKDRVRASIEGAEEVAVAVASSTLTTVAAFLPMVFWTGILGEFMGYLPKVVIIVLTASLVAAVLVLPVLTARVLREPKTRTDGVDDDAAPLDPAGLRPLMRRYHRVLQWSIERRYLSAGAMVALLVGSIGAYAVLGHGVEFFPATDPARATVAVRLPEGADLEATDEVVRAVEAILARVENVETYVAEVGVSGAGNPLGGTTAAANEARITLDFLPSADRAKPDETARVESTFLTIARLRAAFARIPGAQIDVKPEDMGPPVGAPIAVEVTGDDFHEVGAAAQALLRELERIDGTADLQTDYRVGRPELRLRVDRGAARRVGVSTQEIGGAVRTAIAGAKASAIRDGEHEHDIVVEVAPEHKDDLQKILQLRIPGREDTSPSTFPVPLSAVASYELAGGSGTVRHLDQELVVTITGDVADKSREAEIRAAVAAFLGTWEAPPGIHASIGGAADEQAEAAAFLSWAFALAVALVAVVLVAQFDSVTVPGIIMLSVVLSLIGVLWGLILTATPFGIIMTGIGVISLAGVVVNNAIVLLDYVVQLEARGLGHVDALLRAGVTRFRPVLLTAGTTVLGLVPMALGVSFDFFTLRLQTGVSSAQFWGPMAVAVSFGLTFATVLTLVMVPTMYAILVDLRGLAARWRGAVPPVAQAAKVAGLVVAGASLPLDARAVSLDEAFAAAERNSFEMRLVREQTAQARTLRGQAISALLPRVMVDLSYVINQQEFVFDPSSQFGDLLGQPDPAALAPLLLHPDSPFTLDYLNEALVPAVEGLLGGGGDTEPIVIQPKAAWSGNLTLYQPILSGEAIPAWRGAKAVYRGALAQEARARQQLRGGVARAYYGLVSARKAVGVSLQAVDLAKQQAELARRQVEAGTVDALAEMQAAIAVSRAERDVLGARARVVEAETAFARLTGLSAAGPLADPPPVVVPADLDAAVREAIVGRGDVVAAEAQAYAADQRTIAQHLDWLPRIDFAFTEIYNQVPGFIPENFQWRAAFNLKWTLFDGGYRVAKARELASQARAADVVVERQRADLRDEVTLGWERYRRAESSLEVVRAEVQLAEEALRRAEARLAVGRTSWLDVEGARVSVEASRLALVTEQAARDLAAIDLLVAVGAYGG